MKIRKLCFIEYSTHIEVYEAYTTKSCQTPQINREKRYATINKITTTKKGGYFVTEFDFAGDINWDNKLARKLTPEQRKHIEELAANVAKAFAEVNECARKLQACQKEFFYGRLKKNKQNNTQQ